jgi:hypothetical protein
MRTLYRTLQPYLSYILVIAAGVVAWLPLVAAGGTMASVAATPVVDQRSEVLLSTDLASDGSGTIQQLQAPHFNAICGAATGRWAQTITASLTGTLAQVDLLLLRRSADIASPVQVEIFSVDAAGLPTTTMLGRGATTATIPVHRSEADWLRVSLDVPVPLLIGEKAAIFPTAMHSATGNCYEWVSSGLDVYSGGSLAETTELGAGFRLARGRDAAFRTWMQ